VLSTKLVDGRACQSVTKVDASWLDADYSSLHVRALKCSNSITSIGCGFVVQLVPTVVQQLTRSPGPSAVAELLVVLNTDGKYLPTIFPRNRTSKRPPYMQEKERIVVYENKRDADVKH